MQECELVLKTSTEVFSYAVKRLELEMLTVEVVWRSHGVHPYKEGINFMSASKPAVQAIKSHHWCVGWEQSIGRTTQRSAESLHGKTRTGFDGKRIT